MDNIVDEFERRLQDFSEENGLSLQSTKELILSNLDALTLPVRIVYNRDTHQFHYVEEYLKMKGGDNYE